jgi:alpha-tubulin suppressor-like RCC1 family protein
LGDFKVDLVVSNPCGTGTGAIMLRVSPVVVWGPAWTGGAEVPAGLSNVVRISGKRTFEASPGLAFAVTADGNMVGWPNDLYGLGRLPDGVSNILAVASGDFHTVGLTSDGHVLEWIYGPPPQVRTNFSPYLRDVVSVSAGGWWSAALTSGGQTYLWSRDASPWPFFTELPGLAITVSRSHCVALLNYHGSTLAQSWDLEDTSGEQRPFEYPFGWGDNIVSVDAGYRHDVALTSDGRVLTSGTYFDDHDHWLPMEVPAGLINVVAVAAGDAHCLALKADGRVVSWGVYDQSFVPEWLDNVAAIAASGRRSVALMRQPTVPTPKLNLQKMGTNLVLQAAGTQGLAGQLLRASQLSGPWLPANPVLFTNQSQVLLRPEPSEPSQFYRYLPR